MKGKSTVLILLSLLFVGLIAGCVETAPEQPAKPAETGSAGVIKVDGATTAYPIMVRAAAQFMKDHPGVTIDVKQTNTGGGYSKLIDGEINIGMATREPKDYEKTNATAKGVNIYLNHIFYDAVSVITHPSVPIDSINKSVLNEIYFTGKYTDWAQVTNGAKKGKINVYNTNPLKLGTAFVFNKYVTGNENTAYINGTTQFDSLPLMGPAIEKDPNGIGYTQLAGIPAGAKILKLNGTFPSKSTVLDASYPMSRKVYLITNGAPTGAVKDFVNFVLSKDGQRIVEEEGFVALI